MELLRNGDLLCRGDQLGVVFKNLTGESCGNRGFPASDYTLYMAQMEYFFGPLYGTTLTLVDDQGETIRTATLPASPADEENPKENAHSGRTKNHGP